MKRLGLHSMLENLIWKNKVIKNHSSTIANFEMSLFSIKEKINNSNFLIKIPNKKILVKGCCIDTRSIKKDLIFMAIKGKNFDGHNFIETAKEKNAIGAIVEKGQIKDWMTSLIDDKFFLLAVNNVIDAFSELAAKKRTTWNGKLLSVTGSNGKTTAKEIVSNILKKEVGSTAQFSTTGNQNNHIGVPLNLLRLRDEHKFAVLEMGMNQIGEISKLSSIVKPNCALITNAQREHQEFLGSVRKTAIENGSVISKLNAKDIVIFPKDIDNEDIWWGFAERNDCSVIRFSLESDKSICENKIIFKDVICKIKCKNPLTVEFYVNKDKMFSTKLNGFGEHFARTTTAAVAASLALNISNRSIEKGLKSFTPIEGRGLFHHLEDGSIIVDDSYNANPDSVRAAINAMLDLNGRKAMVLGDMGELGRDSQLLHKEILGFAALHLDEVFTIGEYFSNASKDLKFGKPHSTAKSLERDVRSWLQPRKTASGTSVLWVKGSRTSNLDIIVNNLINRNF